MGFPGGSVVKNPPANVGDMGLIPGLGRSPGGGNGNPHQYSCLENPMDRGAWQAPQGPAGHLKDLCLLLKSKVNSKILKALAPGDITRLRGSYMGNLEKVGSRGSTSLPPCIPGGDSGLVPNRRWKEDVLSINSFTLPSLQFELSPTRL